MGWRNLSLADLSIHVLTFQISTFNLFFTQPYSGICMKTFFLQDANQGSCQPCIFSTQSMAMILCRPMQIQVFKPDHFLSPLESAIRWLGSKLGFAKD